MCCITPTTVNLSNKIDELLFAQPFKEMEEGKFSGNGTFIWKDGEKYAGEYLNDLRHGRGVETYPDNDAFSRVSYDGRWKEGKQSGVGKLVWKNGERYVGEFQDDQQNGEGILYSATNKILKQGHWKNGQL